MRRPPIRADRSWSLPCRRAEPDNGGTRALIRIPQHTCPVTSHTTIKFSDDTAVAFGRIIVGLTRPLHSDHPRGYISSPRRLEHRRVVHRAITEIFAHCRRPRTCPPRRGATFDAQRGIYGLNELDLRKLFEWTIAILDDHAHRRWIPSERLRAHDEIENGHASAKKPHRKHTVREWSERAAGNGARRARSSVYSTEGRVCLSQKV